MHPDRKRKTKDPCPTCRMHVSVCFCDQIPKHDLRTRLCLVIHIRELSKTSNTGTLAMHALPNSEMRVRGRQGEVLDLTSQIENPNYHTLLFYPSEDATELTPDYVKTFRRPVQLIVPDGNWRQASKIHYGQTELRDIPRVMIRPTETGTHHMRVEHMAEGMATLQAIAHAYGILEGPEVKESLMRLYETKLRLTLLGRGQKI